MDLALAISPDIVKLPKKIYFDSFEPGFPDVFRIGNLQLDGTVTDTKEAGSKWH